MAELAGKLVITGALGHIGSHLIRRLPQLLPSAEIVLVDNLLTQRYCSLFDLPPACYRFVEADILHAELQPIVAGARAVIHLAAITDATTSFDNRAQVERVNAIGVERVALACLAADVPLLFPSTTSVYGSQAATVDEDCTELRPQSPYACAKLRAEQLLQALHDAGGLRYACCRFGTIFGVSVGMRFHTAVNKFCWLAAQGRPLPVWTTAYDQYRPYLALDDAVDAIAMIIANDLFDGQTYNVLTLNATVRDVVMAIRRRVPGLQVQMVDSEIMNQLSYHVSDRRFRQAGFTPTGDLASGIAETLALFAHLQPAQKQHL